MQMLKIRKQTIVSKKFCFSYSYKITIKSFDYIYNHTISIFGC